MLWITQRLWYIFLAGCAVIHPSRRWVTVAHLCTRNTAPLVKPHIVDRLNEQHTLYSQVIFGSVNRHVFHLGLFALRFSLCAKLGCILCTQDNILWYQSLRKTYFLELYGQHNVCCPHVCVFSMDAPVLSPNPKTCRRVVDSKCPVLCKWECEAVKTGCLPMYQSCDRLETCLGCSTGGEAH